MRFFALELPSNPRTTQDKRLNITLRCIAQAPDQVPRHASRRRDELTGAARDTHGVRACDACADPRARVKHHNTRGGGARWQRCPRGNERPDAQASRRAGGLGSAARRRHDALGWSAVLPRTALRSTRAPRTGERREGSREGMCGSLPGLVCLWERPAPECTVGVGGRSALV